MTNDRGDRLSVLREFEAFGRSVEIWRSRRK